MVNTAAEGVAGDGSASVLALRPHVNDRPGLRGQASRHFHGCIKPRLVPITPQPDKWHIGVDTLRHPGHIGFVGRFAARPN